MKTVKLLVPLLFGDTHRPAGYLASLADERAAELVRLGHAAVPPVETASRPDPPRKAARLAGRAE